MKHAVAGLEDRAPAHREADWPSGVCLLQFPVFDDSRGTLIPMDAADLPFPPRRVFVVAGSDGGSLRGGHAHRSARQLMVCVAGCVKVVARNAHRSVCVDLIPDGSALLVEPGVWATQEYRSPHDRLLVLASEPYCAESYQS